MADAIAALLQAEAGERMAARFEVGQRVTVTDHKYGRYIGQQGTVVAHPATIPADVHADVWVLLDSQDPRVAAVGFDADQVTRETEPYMIGGYHACGALVDGGRCGRAPGHEGHPHIKDPGTETSGEYYVMAHGYTAPASRPVARFPYRSPEAGDALDRALAWARQYVKTSFDLLHADASGSALIAQVMADGQFVWVRR